MIHCKVLAGEFEAGLWYCSICNAEFNNATCVFISEYQLGMAHWSSLPRNVLSKISKAVKSCSFGIITVYISFVHLLTKLRVSQATNNQIPSSHLHAMLYVQWCEVFFSAWLLIANKVDSGGFLWFPGFRQNE